MNQNSSLDIVAKKHGGGRGQAFVVFSEQANATAAMRALSGELFYLKEMVCVDLCFLIDPCSTVLHMSQSSLLFVSSST